MNLLKRTFGLKFLQLCVHFMVRKVCSIFKIFESGFIITHLSIKMLIPVFEIAYKNCIYIWVRVFGSLLGIRLVRSIKLFILWVQDYLLALVILEIFIFLRAQGIFPEGVLMLIDLWNGWEVGIDWIFRRWSIKIT